MEGKSDLSEFLRSQVPDWEDDIVTAARFKAFTGQRQDWESRYQFWKRLVVNVSRHLDLILIEPAEVQTKWFARNGLVPLGLNTVLMEMLKAEELQSVEEFTKQNPSNIRWAFNQFTRAAIWAGRAAVGISWSGDTNIANKKLIVTELLQERTEQAVKLLNKSQWSTSCVITMAKFRELCGGFEASNVLQSYLVQKKRAQHLEIERDYKIEGLKISLNQSPIPKSTAIDLHLLQLYWTKEKLQQQIDVLDSQVLKYKISAAAALKNGERQKALRQLRCMKMTSASRETCTGFAERIDEVLSVISDAETTNKVAEAMKVGSVVIKEHHVTLEELHECLDDIAEVAAQQKQLEEALAGPSLMTGDVDLEDELAELESELEPKSVASEPRRKDEGICHPSTATPEGSRANTAGTAFADGCDFERELAQLDAELGVAVESWPADQKKSLGAQAGPRSSSQPKENHSVTVRRGSMAVSDAGDIRQKESEQFELEFAKLRLELEPA